MKRILLFLLIILIITAISALILKKENNTTYLSPIAKSVKPQISGWIAWWKEEQGYNNASNYSGYIHSVSPVWFMVDKNLQLSEIGSVNRKQEIEDLKNKNISIMPSLGSEIGSDNLGTFLNDDQKSNELIRKITTKLNELDVDGLDVDLEGIPKKDKEKFTEFLDRLHKSLLAKGLKMSVAVHAQTGHIVWEGVEGQDLAKIGQIADEVRIMAYDENSAGSDPGPIASFKWITKIIQYNLDLIDKDKIVLGIPSYGYIWTSDDAKGLQYDEFYSYLNGKKYKASRDKNSGELTFSGEDFTGWLSDSEAMKAKMDLARNEGINRFVIWHLGGLDEKIFNGNF